MRESPYLRRRLLARLCLIAVPLAAVLIGCSGTQVEDELPSLKFGLPLGLSLGAAEDSQPVFVAQTEEAAEARSAAAPPPSALPERFVTLSAFGIPYAKLKADEDENEPDLGRWYKADLDDGYGWGARVGYGRRSGWVRSSLGVLYQTSLHKERDYETSARAHAAYLELLLDGAFPRDSEVKFVAGAGFGVGGAVIDFHHYFDDTGGAAIEGRLILGVEIGSVLEAGASGALFLWGYPGETMGYGSFVTLGGGLRF